MTTQEYDSTLELTRDLIGLAKSKQHRQFFKLTEVTEDELGGVKRNMAKAGFRFRYMGLAGGHRWHCSVERKR